MTPSRHFPQSAHEIGENRVGAPLDVKRIAVIGAGSVGREIACLAGQAGYKTILEDLSDDRLAKGVAWIAQAPWPCGAGGVAAQLPGASAGNLLLAHSVEDAIREADLIIVTLPDEMEAQIELFTILDKFAKPNAIFASTGWLSITELAEVTFCADRCIGMRFRGNIRETKLVELVKGAMTSSETVATCFEVARRMGREVRVLEDPGAAEPAGAQERKSADAQD